MFDDGSGRRDGVETELQAATEGTARTRRELGAIESDLTRVVEMFLQATGRSDLAAGFLCCLGNTRRTLH